MVSAKVLRWRVPGFLRNGQEANVAGDKRTQGRIVGNEAVDVMRGRWCWLPRPVEGSCPQGARWGVSEEQFRGK